MRSKNRLPALLLLAGLLSGLAGPAFAGEGTVILAYPQDPYYALAEKIAAGEGLPIAATLHQALAADPARLLWVAAPFQPLGRAVVAFDLTLRDRRAWVSLGLLSGATLEGARSLDRRAPEATAQRPVAVNAANPAAHLEARMLVFREEGVARAARWPGCDACWPVRNWTQYSCCRCGCRWDCDCDQTGAG